jgi:hypothetical protein
LLAEQDRVHFQLPDRLLERAAFRCERQVEILEPPIEIGVELRRGSREQRRRRFCNRARRIGGVALGLLLSGGTRRRGFLSPVRSILSDTMARSPRRS